MNIQEDFRLAMRRYIYSVSIMSNKDEKGDTNAITVSSVTSISMEPPSLLICINKSSRIHDTLKVGSQFCINLLNKHQIELSNICSDEDSYENLNSFDAILINFWKGLNKTALMVAFHTQTIKDTI